MSETSELERAADHYQGDNEISALVAQMKRLEEKNASLKDSVAVPMKK